MSEISGFKKIIATFEIITPMFIGDGLQQPDSVRPTSVKGALRFWWRALIWAKLASEYESNNEAIKALHKQELELFGSASKTEGNVQIGGQGKVTIRVSSKHPLTKCNHTDYLLGPESNHAVGIVYLLGPGRQSLKIHLEDGSHQQFTVQLILNGVNNAQCQQLEDTLFCFGLLGGLGARSRKGFGSIALLTLKQSGIECPIPSNIDEYKQKITSLFLNAKSLKNLPPFTAFSNKMQSDISCIGENYKKVLNEIGSKQQLYRSYGYKGKNDKIHKVNKVIALQLFKNDHDAIYFLVEKNKFKKHPRRLVFGLPHNYYLSKEKKIIEVNLKSENMTRRASPLFIHVHKLNGKYIGVQTLIPAQFFPDGSKIDYKIKKVPTSERIESSDIDWSVIQDYLELSKYNGTTSGFIDRQPIFTRESV